MKLNDILDIIPEEQKINLIKSDESISGFCSSILYFMDFSYGEFKVVNIQAQDDIIKVWVE